MRQPTFYIAMSNRKTLQDLKHVIVLIMAQIFSRILNIFLIFVFLNVAFLTCSLPSSFCFSASRFLLNCILMGCFVSVVRLALSVINCNLCSSSSIRCFAPSSCASKDWLMLSKWSLLSLVALSWVGVIFGCCAWGSFSSREREVT